MNLKKSVVILWALCLYHCAPVVKYHQGLQLMDTKRIEGVSRPDSLRAVLKITVYEEKKKSSLTTVLAMVPETRYKMDFKGPMGSHLGSFYWVADSLWSLIIPGEDLFYQGKHDKVTLSLLKLERMMIHHMVGFLWGGYLREGVYEEQNTAKKDKVFREIDKNTVYRIGPENGLVKSASFSKYKIEYIDYETYNGRPLAGNIKIYQYNQLKYDELLLEMKVKTLEDNPSWNKSPFFIKVPRGLTPVRQPVEMEEESPDSSGSVW
ncbi:hypothetical protein ACFL5V_10670 [Fibrobacterota bacterium]